MNASNNAPAMTIEEKEAALTNIGFFVGGLTDEAIAFYYTQLIAE